MLKLASIGFVLTLAGTACAQAGVSYSFSVDPPSVPIGGTATVKLSLAFIPDAGFTFDYFEGDGTIDSGDGQDVSVSWNSQTVSFAEPFTYAMGGLYTPIFSGQYTYAEDDGVVGRGGAAQVEYSASLAVGTPESQTWAMIIVGFVGIGAMGLRGQGRQQIVYDIDICFRLIPFQRIGVVKS